MVFYFFGFETLTKGRSIGKFITGTKVVTLEGEIPTANVFLKRSFCRIIPFEAFSFLAKTVGMTVFLKLLLWLKNILTMNLIYR